jgi:hypothetical protein
MFFVGIFGLSLFYVFMPELVFVSAAVSNTQFSNNISSHLMNFCLAWIGPIPAYSAGNHPANIIVCSYSIMKVYFSFFGIFGIYKAIKIKDKKIYPLIMIIVFNTILLIVTFNSLDFRFAYPVSFIYMILMVYGFGALVRNKFYITKIISLHNSIIQLCFLLLCIGLTFFYNFR